MKKIEMTPYEQKDILHVLNYAQEEYKYRARTEKQGMSKYWIERIEHLKRVIEGKCVEGSFIESSILQMLDK